MAPEHATVLVEASWAPIARGVLRLDADPEAPSAASTQSRRSARLALGVLVTIALVPVIGWCTTELFVWDERCSQSH